MNNLTEQATLLIHEIDLPESFTFHDRSTLIEQLKEVLDISKHESSACPCKSIELEIPFSCDNVRHTFHIEEFRLRYHTQKRQFEMDMEYTIYKCDEEYSFVFFSKPFSTMEEVVDHLMEILWEGKLCRECLHLMQPNEKGCQKCMPSKLVMEYGMEKGKVSNYPTCSICLDPVLKHHLECGHYFHKKCFLGLNKKKWFEDDSTILCPMCRMEITSNDKLEYFFYEEEEDDDLEEDH